jgi:hypothetical protein
MNSEEDTFNALRRPSITNMVELVRAEAHRNRSRGDTFYNGCWWDEPTLEKFLNKHGWTSTDYFSTKWRYDE